MKKKMEIRLKYNLTIREISSFISEKFEREISLVPEKIQIVVNFNRTMVVCSRRDAKIIGDTLVNIARRCESYVRK